jgi:magnesium transporter
MKQRKKTRKLHPQGTNIRVGLSPGSLVHVGNIKTGQTRFDLVRYKNDLFEEELNINLDSIPDRLKEDAYIWIRVTGLQDTVSINKLATIFNIHPLIIEDILNTVQRPKTEFLDNYIFLTLKTLHINSGEFGIDSDQESLLLFEKVLISFHENDLPLYEPVTERMKLPGGRLRTRGVDYLFYALVDVIVDNYYVAIEAAGDYIDNLEDSIFDEKSFDVLESIQAVKKDLLFIRKSVYPLREALGTLIKAETDLIDSLQTRYLTDVYDHLIQIYENIESLRDLNAGLKDIYLSMLSNKMNQIMKLLTIISTIFIPLTFIVGLYGMNFDFMPELHWRYGYLFVWIVMTGVTAVMFRWFRKKKWL